MCVLTSFSNYFLVYIYNVFFTGLCRKKWSAHVWTSYDLENLFKSISYLINSLSCTYKSSQEAFNCWGRHFEFQKIQDSRFHLQNLQGMICFRFANFKYYKQNKLTLKQRIQHKPLPWSMCYQLYNKIPPPEVHKSPHIYCQQQSKINSYCFMTIWYS
jgi:hypothetical protein